MCNNGDAKLCDSVVRDFAVRDSRARCLFIFVLLLRTFCPDFI